MEKARKGIKPVKFPKTLFSEWRNIIQDYVKTHDSIKLIPAVIALQKLTTFEDATYDRQAACIKEAVKLMQKNVNSIEKLQSEELEQIQLLVEPIASLGYFAACENLSRRAFVPLIEIAVRCTKEPKDIFFRRYYLQYTTTTATRSIFDEKPLAERALTIYATLKFPLGHEVIVENYEHTLRFLIDGLEKALQQTTIAQNNTAADQLMNDIQFAVKSFLVLFSRQLTVATNLLLDNSGLHLLSRIMQTLLDLCVDTTTFIKECNQVAGMAIGAIINLVDKPEMARDWILDWFFTKQQEVISAVPLNVNYPREKFASIESWNCRDAPILFILRGLVSSLRKEIIVLALPTQVVLNPLIESSSARNLHEVLYACINLFCARADLDASCKVIAFESMATWLQQTKEMMDKCDNNKTFMDAISGSIQPNNVNTLVQYVWDHWEDPIDSIQHKVRAIFELSLSAFQLKTTFYGQHEEYLQFMNSLLKNLLTMDWHRKVKYSLLNMLVEKVPTTDLFLTAEPQLMQKCMWAMDSFILCPQITYFILAFLYRRVQDTIPGHQDFKGHNGKIKDSEDSIVKDAIQAWIDLWVPSLLHCLTAPSELLRKNISGFLLQPLFKVAPQSFWYIVHVLQKLDHPLWSQQQSINPDLRLNAFIAVLKAGRGLDLVNGGDYTTEESTGQNEKKISIETLKLAVYHSDDQVRLDVLGLLCESRKATAQVTTTELEMLKLFLPLNMNSTAPEFRQQMCAHLSKILMRLRGNLYSQHRSYKSLLVYADKNTGVKRDDALLDAQDILVVMDQAKAFLCWLCDHTADSLYPGASYQRVATSLRILSMMIKVFGVTGLPAIEGFKDEQPDFPFKVPIATPQLTKLLVDVFMNPYDFNRVQAFDILSQFPSPLPGIDSKQDVQDLLWWGLNHVVSTRAGESDSGAMIFRLIFTKYVLGLGYDLSPEQQAIVTNKPEMADQTTSALVFTERLLDLLEKQASIAKSNLLLAAQQHPMHGTLLALQYAIQELDYSSSSVTEHLDAWRKIHTRVINLIHTICDTVMPVLSDASPEGNVPTDYREEEHEEDDDELNIDSDDSGPKHQVILSCCWRAVKEASTLLQAIISKASAAPTSQELLTHEDLINSGQLFRHLLTSIRHRGAFSAVYPAYVSLNTRLLASRDPALAQLPSRWLQENLESLTSSNISITRRSAGLPLCILAIVSSELSMKRELTSKAMNYLMELAHDEPPVDADQRIDLPQVHAYNIMRTIFMDSKLGTQVLEYASSGFSLAIRGFSSHSWAIRNCAVMLFSTLLQRTFGTKKTRDEHDTVNTLTGREFFIRFPDLHPYLLKELGVAVDQLLKNSLAASVHPGLYPILTLLSRMQPSTETVTENQETILTPFVPLVIPCAASAIYKTREMAARALVPLVLDVAPVIKQLMSFPDQITQNEIHGRLLQVQFLLRGHFYSNNGNVSFVEFINDMPDVMLNLLYDRQLCNINCALLLNIIGEFFFDTKWITGKDEAVAKELLELTQTKFITIRKKTKEYCMHVIKDDQMSGIGSYLVRESMANIITLSTLFNNNNANLTDLLFLLVDRDYEVRLLVLQKLLNYFVKSTFEEYHSSVKQLQCLLVERTYGGEDSLNCYVLTAKLLMILNSADPYPMDMKMPFSLEQYWNKLVVQFGEKRALSVTESVLPLLSALLAQILRCPSPNTEWIQQCLVTWSGYIEKYSQKDITLPLREAVVKSLSFTCHQLFTDYTNTFKVHGKDVEDARITAAFAVTQLLQDDDVDVRHDMAAIVSRALNLQAPVHHERALEIVHRYLTAQFSTSSLLEAMLMTVLTENDNLQQVWENELSQSKALFAKENPNIYKEDLVDLQWANVDLDTIHLKHMPEVKNFEPITFRIQQLLSFNRAIQSTSRSIMQNGPYGLTSKASVFKAAYSTILALHLDMEALDHLKSIPQEVLQNIKSLASTLMNLEESWVHPLLWILLRGEDGLYSKIKQLLKRHNGHVVFEQMFLLSPDSRLL